MAEHCVHGNGQQTAERCVVMHGELVPSVA
jgi:hypothetical protein